MLAEQEHGAQVRVEDGVPALLRALRHRAVPEAPAADPVGGDDVQPSAPLVGRGDGRPGARVRREVGDEVDTVSLLAVDADDLVSASRKRSTVAPPMPPAAPVTSATLPSCSGKRRLRARRVCDEQVDEPRAERPTHRVALRRTSRDREHAGVPRRGEVERDPPPVSSVSASVPSRSNAWSRTWPPTGCVPMPTTASVTSSKRSTVGRTAGWRRSSSRAAGLDTAGTGRVSTAPPARSPIRSTTSVGPVPGSSPGTAPQIWTTSILRSNGSSAEARSASVAPHATPSTVRSSRSAGSRPAAGPGVFGDHDGDVEAEALLERAAERVGGRHRLADLHADDALGPGALEQPGDPEARDAEPPGDLLLRELPLVEQARDVRERQVAHASVYLHR